MGYHQLPSRMLSDLEGVTILKSLSTGEVKSELFLSKESADLEVTSHLGMVYPLAFYLEIYFRNHDRKLKTTITLPKTSNLS